MYSEPSSCPRRLPYLEFLIFVPATAAQLSLYYLPKTRSRVDPLKYVVFLGSLGAPTFTLALLPSLTILTVSPESIMDCAP